MRALITGISGFAGGHLAAELLERGSEVAGLDPATGRQLDALSDRVLFRQGDIRDGEALRSLAANFRPDTIFHLAAITHVAQAWEQRRATLDINVIGTAAVLELARLLVEDPPSADVLVAFLDAEEVGLQGARALVRQPPVPFPASIVNVNLDMVSRSGGTLWAAGAHHTPARRPILETVAQAGPATLRLGQDRPDAPEGDDWTHASDHGPFHEAGIPFVYFGVEDHEDYHRPSDDVEKIVPSEFEASVRTISAAVRALDAALPLIITEPAR